MKKLREFYVTALYLLFLLSFAFALTVNASDPSYKNDFDGDGKTDIAVFDKDGGCGILAPSPAYFRYKSSLTGQIVSVQWGNSCHSPLPADYDDDGITDPAIFNGLDENNDPTNQWWVNTSTNGGFFVLNFGLPQQFVPRDYDGIAAAQPATLQLQIDRVDENNPNDDFGLWTFNFLDANGESTQTIVTDYWTPTHQSSQYAAPGDYEGLGFSRPAVFDRIEKRFWLYTFTTPGGFVLSGKPPLDIEYPTPGDFDGDGRTDFAGIDGYENPSATNLIWRVKYNTANNPLPYNLQIAWGVPGDKAVPGDYDGDGKTDIAVFRPGNTTWYIRRSSDAGTTTQVFGESDDIPVALPIQSGQY